MNYPSRDMSNSSHAARSTATEANVHPNDYSVTLLGSYNVTSDTLPASYEGSPLFASGAASPHIAGSRRRLRVTGTGLDIFLPAPLSQLTENLHDVPIKDMEAWVSRSADVRRREARNKGKIARPMNSFMLYRSAYAERVKRWCARNSHMLVSQISGASWLEEPPEIRKVYESLASVEKENHRRAHPEYKFAPNKSRVPSRKKRPDRNGSDDTRHWLGSLASWKPGKRKKRDFDHLESAQHGDDPLVHASYDNPSRFIIPSVSVDNAHSAGPIGLVMNHGYTPTGFLSISQEPLHSCDSPACMYGSDVDQPLLITHHTGLDMRSDNLAKSLVQPYQDQSSDSYMSMTAPTGHYGAAYDPLHASYIL